MKVVRGTLNIPAALPYPVVAIGNFDGVHTGHQMIFRKTADLARAHSGTSIAFTFEPHPLKIIAPEKVPPLLTNFRKKMELIEVCGIDMVVCADFNRRFADQHPRDFAKNVLAGRVGVKEIVVGFDYAFGKGREGTVDYLKKMGEEFGFIIHVMEPIKVDGNLVSSSYVRELIEEGDMETAARFLGRPYSLIGPVVPGYKTGQTIGFPTANIDTSKVKIPRTGVYAVRACLHNRVLDGAVNVGFNPTFNRDTLSVEVHLFDFREDIYGREIEVEFIRRIRDEKQFNSREELIVQIEKDIETARNILGEKH
ncbi:MAG: riboflavin biosynthesis protein RibF [Nitrospinae bacterium CG11_big_fil_rev_8_21_14_0_20_56_8]|nr:MAG: riboflavin biosynthesis protein RibF [Nitrospinae bacterium CG11_big_fil_rev_8_21_14_0_20_56_8]